ncbi:MAG: four helix bundle protein [Saprospiraceae bacterium]|nr:four helix bundle protein [Saprospiraceae bacterium]MCF8249943.1 four helix bundle protein [Saprospiraceae bacterium]MCF8279356.1 four helix bundle protein [Bacteroidales bacterium]MCF8310047.1 four helix bundle protein [Saprospiraceae bacterium]MCF8438947.1 four helix bundle protein [Saprospiraceae bacterium]
MSGKELQDRLKRFAVSIVKFAEALPETPGFRTIRNQIVRNGPSSAANYRAACRPKSNADFISKLGTVEEELDETLFWHEFTVALADDFRAKIAPLWKEGNELLAIIVASIVTTKKETNNKKALRQTAIGIFRYTFCSTSSINFDVFSVCKILTPNPQSAIENPQSKNEIFHLPRSRFPV